MNRERWLIWLATAAILLACVYGCMAVDPNKGRGLQETRPRARAEAPFKDLMGESPPRMPSFEDLLGSSRPSPAVEPEPIEEEADAVDESNSTRPADVEPNLQPPVRRSAVGRVLPVVFMAAGLAAVAWMRSRSRERTDGQIEGAAAADSDPRPGG